MIDIHGEAFISSNDYARRQNATEGIPYNTGHHNTENNNNWQARISQSRSGSDIVPRSTM